jgi:hypothetical protein
MNPFLIAMLILAVVFFVMMIIGYSFYAGAGMAASIEANRGYTRNEL